MKVLLISGHGAGDPGAIGVHNGVTYREADLTREVTAWVASELLRYCDVDIYPTGRNAFNDHLSGTSALSFRSYDYVLEVHFNAFQASREDGVTKGTEIYVVGGRKDTTIEQTIVDGISACGLTNRGVKKYGWAVIASAERAGTPAALLEVCFIDDPDDIQIYNSRLGEIIHAIVRGLVTGLKLGEVSREPTMREKVQARFGFDDNTMRYLDGHPWPNALFEKLATAE